MKTKLSVVKTRNFVKQQFKKHPHFTYDDWRIMYEHSLLVENLALKIAKTISCDKELLYIGALLHDIGKTEEADEDTLHVKHEDFNLKISNDFLNKLELNKNRLQKLKEIISYKSDSIELKIIKDADALALYFDKRLYMLFIKWAKNKNLQWAIERKIKKYDKLNFSISKKIGLKSFNKMKSDWKKFTSLT